MNKTYVIMCPTVQRAMFEWKAFLTRWATIIKKANRANLYVELLSGYKIYFKSETEGQRVLKGLHVNIFTIDEFLDKHIGKEKYDKKKM